MTWSDDRARYLQEFQNCAHVSGAARITGSGGEQIVWDGNDLGEGENPMPATALPCTLESDDVQDDASGGSGATRCRVWGLDEDYVFRIEEVDLAGLTPVALQYEYRRNFRVRVIDQGGDTWNVGNLRLKQSDGTVIGYVFAEKGITRTSVFTVPAGFAYMVEDYSYSGGIQGLSEGVVRLRDDAGVVYAPIELVGRGGGSDWPIPSDKPFVIPETWDVWFGMDLAQTGVVGTRMVGELDTIKNAGLDPSGAASRTF